MHLLFQKAVKRNTGSDFVTGLLFASVCQMSTIRTICLCFGHRFADKRSVSVCLFIRVLESNCENYDIRVVLDSARRVRDEFGLFITTNRLTQRLRFCLCQTIFVLDAGCG